MVFDWRMLNWIQIQLASRAEEVKLSASNDLVSSICVSQKDTANLSAVRYFGVSMPTYSRNPKLFFVAASHLSIWDCYLTDEVMTYYPKKSTKQYFEIRSDVRCLTSVKDDKLILAVHVRSCLVRQQVKQSSGSVATVPTWQISFYVFLKS